jgi:hypothetical protein
MAKVFYRSIYAGTKTINDVPARWLDDVKALFKVDVASGKITAERYEEITGEPYVR